MKSLDLVNKNTKDITREDLRENIWFKYLYLTKQNNVNLEQVTSLEKLEMNQTLKYVKKTLEILNQFNCKEEHKEIVEEVLIWSEVAKCGLNSHRKDWESKGYNLFSHNLGSAEIYKEEKPENELIYILIKTHGLMGQYLRGEVNLASNKEVHSLIENNIIDKDSLRNILLILNECIISAVNLELWNSIKNDITLTINNIVNNNFIEFSTIDRIKKLRKSSSENIDELLLNFNKNILIELENLFKTKELWFVESALKDFSLEEFFKIMLITEKHGSNYNNISFENLMKNIYYDHNGIKKINIYKKRIIESYLKDIDINNLNYFDLNNKHISISTEIINDTLIFDFNFSKVGSKLIEFCVEAEKEDIKHEQAIILLFDLFELRRDQYDRFHNEEKYLADMHNGGDDKKVILNYIKGENILDVGPGSGIMLDILEEHDNSLNVTGIDFSQNVINVLNERKFKENKAWKLVKGDAFNMSDYFEKDTFDSIIFSSVIHEFFSYLEKDGFKFNLETVSEALKSAYTVLKPGGRIIIRDGIMSETSHFRIIKFKDGKDIEILKKYKNDFKGREIQYEVLSSDTVKMNENDAMEFLYTYTWGEESYVHEVNEQFGYLSKSKYEELIYDSLGKDNVKVIKLASYLQEGYPENLKDKIEYFDENFNEVVLPDSTAIIVIEKI